ncbi:MAG: ABC transporter substrate-binding protein [Syntrophobacteraceae bacterium]|nr:ABC transporter substrate-binding protein [Syntrophobacteraceae bacterium]
MNIQLQTLIRSITEMAEEKEGLAGPEKLDLLLYAPCPVKLVMKERIERIVHSHRERNVELSVHIPMGCTSVDPYDPVYLAKDAGELPAIIGSIGFGDFWKKEFVNRFVREGVFEAVLAPRVNPMFEKAGLIDPRGCYTIYGVTPYIFLVDTRKLGGRAIPRTWEDLLDVKYRNEIVMCGDGDDMADAVILNMYKDRGLDGLKQLAGNVKSIMHSSQMAKIAGTDDPEAAAVFVIPCFFAESTKRADHVRAVWPEDGAAASPLYFLAKKSDLERLRELIAFFTEGFQTIESASWFIPLGATEMPGLPVNAAIKWIGWNFIEENDVNGLRDELNLVFRAALPGSGERGRGCGEQGKGRGVLTGREGLR